MTQFFTILDIAQCYYRTLLSRCITHSRSILHSVLCELVKRKEMAEATEESQTTTENTLTPKRKYTAEEDESHALQLFRWYQLNSRPYKSPPFLPSRLDFQTRRAYSWKGSAKKSLRIRIGNSNEIGAFVRLTNDYFLVGGYEECESVISTVKGDLDGISVINASIAGCRVLGRMCVGNKHGLIVPDGIYDTELRNITGKLPDCVKVRKVEEKLSALGNVISCNDNIALIHPDLDKETEEIIADTLQVEVFRHTLGGNPMVGSSCVLNNAGGLVGVDVNDDFLQDLSSLLQLPLLAGTVNSGSKVVASGLVVNDSIGYAGIKTTANEFRTIETAFQFSISEPCFNFRRH